MVSSRQLKTKIRAVGNIRQITRAMEMVSATKMRRSQEVALNARQYAKKSFSLLAHLLKQANKEELESIFLHAHRSLGEGGEEKIALVVITSDKGLCGSFNSSVLRQMIQWKQEQESAGKSFDSAQGKQVDVVAVGRKGRDFCRAREIHIAAEFFQFSDVATFADIAPVAEWIMRAYEDKAYDKIVVVSNQFVSALVQKVEMHQLLPLQIDELERAVQGIIPKTGKYSELTQQDQEPVGDIAYVLEPSGEEIVRILVRNLIQVMITHFIFESNASEHSARMMAMKNATENAESMMEALNLELNKSRQASITQQLTEISTAKEALMSE